jgi:hypothetical protein
MDVLLKQSEARALLRALEVGSTQERDAAAQQLKAAMGRSRQAGSRRRTWFLISRVLPILAVWGLLARLAYSLRILTLPQAAVTVAAGAGACLVLPAVANLLLWLPLAALQYAALTHLVATCAFPQACGSCNWALSRALGSVNVQQLQQIAAAMLSWLPIKVSLAPAWNDSTPATLPAS